VAVVAGTVPLAVVRASLEVGVVRVKVRASLEVEVVRARLEVYTCMCIHINI
jgi:hypothetical protein